MHYQKLELSSACETVLEIGNAGNLYIDSQAPWTLFKQGGTAFETAAKVFLQAVSLNFVRIDLIEVIIVAV